MDALVPAFVGALLSEIGDKTPWAAMALGLRFKRPVAVIAGIGVAAAAASTISGLGGAAIGRLISPNATTLLLALALISAAAGALMRWKPPESVDRWRLGAFATTALAIFILQFGDRTQFITAAIAANSPTPALAAIGATLGIVAVSSVAVLAGQSWQRHLPLTAARYGPAALFTLTGLILALNALRLV